MAVLIVQSASATGVAVTYYAAAAGGDSFPNTGREALHVKNGGAGAITVTINSVAPCNQGFDHDLAISIPAGSDRIIGPFDYARFGASVDITYSGVTSVTVAVLKVA